MGRFLFLGDSITDAYRDYDMEGLGEGYVRYIAEQLGLGFDENLRVTNAGRDGFTIDDLLVEWNRAFNESAGKAYDVASVLIGANDTGILVDTGRTEEEAVSNYKEKMHVLADSLAQSGVGKVILIEPFLFPVNEACKKSLPQVRRFAEAARSEASQHGFTFVSTQEVIDRTADRDGYDYLTEDGIHPTDQGHRLLADLWLKAYRQSELSGH
jgi:acyl-CoA thioesterase-1